MPRYRRRSIKRRYIRRRSRRSRIAKGKRKAAKGQRQSETYRIPFEDASTITMTAQPQFAMINAYDLLFNSTQFLNMRSSFDQFKLNSVTLSITFYIPNAGQTAPFEVGIATDRTSVAANNMTVATISSYGSYQHRQTGVAPRLTLKASCIASTIQEKSFYLPCDILGVDPVNIVGLNQQTIPRYRNIYFPWNPVFMYYYNGIGAGWNQQQMLTHIRATLHFDVTFRGLRTPSYNNDNIVRNPQMRAGGEANEEFDPSVSYKSTVNVAPPVSVLKDDLNPVKSSVGLHSPSEVLSALVQKSREYPQFNTVPTLVSKLVTDLGRELYQNWVSTVVTYCVSTFVSVLASLGNYALRSVVASNDSFQGSFIASDARSTFYFTDSTASSGMPEGSSSITYSDYINPFNVGVQLYNFYISAAGDLFNTQSFVNEASSLYLYYGLMSANAGTIRYLYNQQAYGTTVVQWSQTLWNSPVTLGPGKVMIIQFPHSNYWITGLLMNFYYTGSSESDDPINYIFNFNGHQAFCADGFQLYNTSVSTYYSYCIIPNNILTGNYAVSFSVSDNSSSTISTLPEQCFFTECLPLSSFVPGYGVLTNTGLTYSATNFGLVYPLFFSKNKLFI